MDFSQFGANEWLVAELYAKYLADPSSVDDSWRPTLEKISAEAAQEATTPAAPAQPTTPAQAAPTAPAPATTPKAEGAYRLPNATTTATPPRAKLIPADVPSRAALQKELDERLEQITPEDPQVTPLKGMAKALATNMDASIQVPTATSVRTIPAKLMIDNRIVINNHLKRSRGGKVSFTHLIAWALVKALAEFPSQNVYYDVIDGKPTAVHPKHITLGIAVDVPKPDGSRALLVPGIKYADTMTFGEFLAAYDDLIAKARHNKLTAGDFQGITISLTNPGGIGTVHSVPRLMKGQGCIIGAGALEYPAEFQGASSATLNELGISKTITLTSTYDHRVIQGAGSGEFLKIVHGLLLGQQGFYDEIFEALRIPYEPVRWVSDFSIDLADDVNKTSRVQELIHAYRVRGHLMADTDPLEYKQRKHPDLDVLTYGLSLWDLDREFVTGGFGGKRQAKLRDILGLLRDSYCRTVGVEYMHIQSPEQRLWMQSKIEQPYAKPTREEQLRILRKLSEAEAFETFLQTKYVGQKRFSLEGGESIIAYLEETLQGAARYDMEEVAIGMAHRGRLNVLTNIAGKTYGQVFREFEGTPDPRTVQGSGDVKYHLGTEGTFKAVNGNEVKVYLAANPSHLEAVNGVLEGIVRAKLDRSEKSGYPVLPILIHGDAAFAGQGVVYETLQLSQLRGYKTGGTIHVIINNQIGFTTKPIDSRSTVYSTDLARTVQAPIFHVNGDDPEAVVRVAKLALEYRQRFHKDVVVDIICYRRRGHNEGDDPSMTQPLMYNLIEAKRSVRKLYSEALVGRGDITVEESEQANREFHEELERAFAETHAAQTGSIPIVGADLEPPTAQQGLGKDVAVADTGIPRELVELIGDAHENIPEGFTVHPKLAQLLKKRFDMTRKGGIDWAFGELLALGSLLVEGKPVRLTGQDSRRGTFVQRHAVFHDRVNGQEWFPLMNITEDEARLSIYDSPLSEYAVLAFEYGYSVERTDSLVMWEAQFGDFVNGAQTVIDEFISAAEQKWGQYSGLTLLLPHGYEGQGPDHSSARIERFLQLCAQHNLIVAEPSTPASHFHLLRRQAYQRPQKPLVVFTPKSMLRMRAAVSPVEDFTHGTFQPVLPDERGLDGAQVRKVVLLAGKLYWELKAKLEKAGDTSTAIVRVEQFYPVPFAEIERELEKYPNAEVIWAQEEPENQGAWPFVQGIVLPGLDGRTIRGVCRPASASPAAGSMKLHNREQDELFERILG